MREDWTKKQYIKEIKFFNKQIKYYSKKYCDQVRGKQILGRSEWLDFDHEKLKRYWDLRREVVEEYFAKFVRKGK